MFINELGQKISPGDDVVVVSHSTKVLRIRPGKFSGFSKSGHPQVVVMADRYRYRNKKTKEDSPSPWIILNNLGFEYSWKPDSAYQIKRREIDEEIELYTVKVPSLRTYPNKNIFKLSVDN